MRFYRIELTNPTTGASVLPASLGGLPLTSLLPNGQWNPAALNVEFDIPMAYKAAPAGQALVTIWGLGIAAIQSAWGLGLQVPGAGASQGTLIRVFGGMSKGLPLANPAQQGPLVIGQVVQAYGNWIGTDQTVVLVIAAPSGTQFEPKKFVLNWPAGQPLATALRTALSTAFPGIPLRINISPNLVQSHAETGIYPTLNDLSDVALRLSRAIIKTPGYRGVQIVNNGSNVTVTDDIAASTPKAIAFQDMIGQPTWIDPATIQVKLVMRGDLALDDEVTLPPSLVTTTAQAYLSLQDKSTFSGNYKINGIHHYGNYIQPDAASWNTTVNMYPLPMAATGSGAAGASGSAGLG